MVKAVKTVQDANGTTYFFPVQHHKHTIGNAMAFVSSRHRAWSSTRRWWSISTA